MQAARLKTAVGFLAGALIGAAAATGAVWYHEQRVRLDSDWRQVEISERYLQNLLPRGNFSGPEGAAWEESAGITDHKDGVWDCRDRAEYARRHFRRLGYETRPGTMSMPFTASTKQLIGHIWIKVYKNGKFVKDVMKDRVN